MWKIILVFATANVKDYRLKLMQPVLYIVYMEIDPHNYAHKIDTWVLAGIMYEGLHSF